MIHGIACTNPHLKTWENNAVLVSFAYYNKLILHQIELQIENSKILKWVSTMQQKMTL